MSTDLVPISRALDDGIPARVARDLLESFLASLKPGTQVEYAGDLRDFARFAGTPTAALAVDHLLGLTGGAANGPVLEYRTALDDRGLSTATIARRLAALRSMTHMARMLGRIGWLLEFRAPQGRRRRVVLGLDQVAWKRLWSAAVKAVPGRRGCRDRALISLLYDLALRRGEAIGMELADVDLERGTVAIVGKGHTEREPLNVPDITRRALEEWIAARGDWPGPLFTRAGESSRGRLTGEAVRQIVKRLAKCAGLKQPVRPHGLRHSAITQALRLGIPIQQIQKFSRHVKTETVVLYNDEVEDVAGDVAGRVAGQRKLPRTTSRRTDVPPRCQTGPEVAAHAEDQATDA